jgi:hypothetical protein
MVFHGIIFIILLVLDLAHAQNNQASVGFGLNMGKEIVKVDDEWITVFDAPTFLVPILFSTGFRIEPEVGLYQYTRNSDASDYRMNIFFMGAGLYKGRRDGKLRPYFGGRLGLSRVAYKRDYKSSNSDIDDSKKDVVIAPTAGISYFINPNFCFGGEFQLNYIIVGQWDNNDDVSETLIGSKTLIFLRYYLH